MLKLFGEMENGSYIKHPAVEYIKTRAFILCLGSENAKKGSPHLTADGEVLQPITVAVEVHNGLGNVMHLPPLPDHIII